MDELEFHLERMDAAHTDDSRLAAFVGDWLFVEEMIEVFEDARN